MEYHTTANNGDRTIPADILDDLSSRFIINVPEEERGDLIRVFFQIELAHWFYLDFYCTNRKDLPTCHMREFSYIILNHIPSLRCYVPKIDSAFAEWRNYKMSVPTFGAILLNSDWDKVLLVQGYFAKASWGFPKGKVNKQEDPHTCAAREVLEETGFDISNLIDKKQYIEHHFNDQLIRLYIVPGIPENISFQPRTRNEIKKVEWFNLNDLPSTKRDQPSKQLGLGPNAFFLVFPIIRKLKKWIEDQQQQSGNEGSVSSQESINDKEPESPSNIPSESSRMRQQKLFAALSMNEFTKYMNIKKDNVPPEKNNRRRDKHRVPVHGNRTPTERNQTHYVRPTYTPPPRFQKVQTRSPEAVSRAKAYRPQVVSNVNSQNQRKPDNQITVTRVPVTFNNNEKPLVARSSTWANFELDKKALIACFNIYLRNPTY